MEKTEWSRIFYWGRGNQYAPIENPLRERGNCLQWASLFSSWGWGKVGYYRFTRPDNKEGCHFFVITKGGKVIDLLDPLFHGKEVWELRLVVEERGATGSFHIID